MRVRKESVVGGLVGGALAATVLIVFFFFFDLARGDALATPAFLAEALLQTAADGGPGVMIAFTAAHYVAFMALGVFAAVLFELTGAPQTMLVGAAYGLFVCSLVFYAALVLTGSDILAAPGWPAVFGGNVIAGMIIVGYLRWASRDDALDAAPDEHTPATVIRHGVIAGLIGASIVAVWFLIVDSVTGRPLFTPAALGSIVLYGAEAQTVVISTWTVLGYSLVHAAGFVLFGIIINALVTEAERFPPFVFGLIVLFVVFETFSILLIAMLGNWLMAELAWWSLLAGNLFAAVGIGLYMWRVHPKLRRELSDDALWASS